jgi:PHD/YefM family antitoxin component YafN of YafNO toxin-antitoxin module
MEQVIGATELRQQLTDVLQAVREQRATYIVETFGRSQAAIVNLEEYNDFRRYRQERQAAFERLDRVAAANAEHVRSLGLSEADVLALIEQAREEVYQEYNRS